MDKQTPASLHMCSLHRMRDLHQLLTGDHHMGKLSKPCRNPVDHCRGIKDHLANHQPRSKFVFPRGEAGNHAIMHSAILFYILPRNLRSLATFRVQLAPDYIVPRPKSYVIYSMRMQGEYRESCKTYITSEWEWHNRVLPQQQTGCRNAFKREETFGSV